MFVFLEEKNWIAEIKRMTFAIQAIEIVLKATKTCLHLCVKLCENIKIKKYMYIYIYARENVQQMLLIINKMINSCENYIWLNED